MLLPNMFYFFFFLLDINKQLLILFSYFTCVRSALVRWTTNGRFFVGCTGGYVPKKDLRRVIEAYSTLR